jgi:phospholipid/cholesterol/gamma-HCH transport system substrate-binding protein
MGGVIGPLWKSIAFVVITGMATLILAYTVQDGSTAPGPRYQAVFEDVTSLNVGDDIRMAGVRVGRVESVSVFDRDRARVVFTVDAGIELTADVRARILFRNLIGQRYIALHQGEDRANALEPGGNIPLDRTQPALDLTKLFNGFQPLFRALDPEDINALSYQLIQVFQGDGGIGELIHHTAQLASTLADRDEVIGQIIANLDVVMATVAERSDEMTKLLRATQLLISGLADDKEAISSAIDGMGAMARSVGDLLEGIREPFTESVAGLDGLSGNLVDSRDVLDRTLKNLPRKTERLGRTVSYGSWVNFYLCEVGGNIPEIDGYQGSVGVNSTAARCRR